MRLSFRSVFSGRKGGKKEQSWCKERVANRDERVVAHIEARVVHQSKFMQLLAFNCRQNCGKSEAALAGEGKAALKLRS